MNKKTAMEELTREGMDQLATEAAAALNDALDQISWLGAMHEEDASLMSNASLEETLLCLESATRILLSELSFFAPGTAHHRAYRHCRYALDCMLTASNRQIHHAGY